MAAFDDIREAGGEGANHWYHVTLKEGRNREVRRLWEAVGLTVSRLIRVRFGSLSLPRNLPRGTWRDATEEEVGELLAAAKMPAATPRPKAGPRKKLTLARPKRAPRRT